MKRASINWEDARKLLRANENSLRETLSESPERIKTIFHKRAVQLAKAHIGERPVCNGIPALIFRTARERHAIALQEVAEVLPFRGCTQIPGAPQQYLGVINLRGELRPVIDLARVLSGSPSIESGAVLVLRRGTALKVDAVEALREIASEELTHPVQGQYIQPLASGALGLVDVDAMLSAVFSTKES
jgi:purine-binding chemotaxis protein CheW